MKTIGKFKVLRSPGSFVNENELIAESTRGRYSNYERTNASSNQMLLRLTSFEIRLIAFIEIVIILIGIILSHIPLNDLIWPPESYFYSRITLNEQDQVFELLANFQWAAESADVTYFLSSGSFIGAIRHHGLIPWDDDVDVYVAIEDKAKLRKALKLLEPRFKIQDDSMTSLLDRKLIWKLFDPNRGRTFIHHKFTWPSLDVFFVSTNGSRVTDQIGELDLPKTHVFPLKRIPFGKSLSVNPYKRNLTESLWLPVTCKYIDPSYLQICLSPSYSHTMEFPTFRWSQRSINCSRLFTQYPFVVRYVSKHNSSYEDLRIDRAILYRLYMDNKECDGSTAHQSEPFNLRRLNSESNFEFPVFQSSGFKMNLKRPT